MTLSDRVKEKPFHFAGLVAFLVLLTQFNTGIKLVYSKWSADEAAADAKKTAIEAKDQAENVDNRFDRYIEQQKQAIETQNKVAEAIANYAAQQQANMVQQIAPAAGQEIIRDEDPDGILWCCDTTRPDCWENKTWYKCD